MATNPSGSDSTDASELGRREFTKVRKGWDPVEVRAHMLRMADEIEQLRRAEGELRARVERHETAASQPEELDESRLMQLLGEETARVLEAARAAASDIRAKAEDNAARLVREAQERATRVTRDADELRQAAVREADELVGAARQRADELLDEARETSRELRQDAEAEATATRERAERAAADARAEAEADAERMRASAAEVRAEADEHATRVRREADEAAVSTREAAEAAAAELRDDAEAAAERVRSEAADAARVRAEEASRAAQAELERAREQGRGMVHEAKEARERMLRDLAERRKVARQQLEALRAGRERLLEAFQSVRGAFDDATDQLVESLPAARAAADEAARAVDDDIDAAVAELDAEIDGRFEETFEDVPAEPAPVAVAPALDSPTSSGDGEVDGATAETSETAPSSAHRRGDDDVAATSSPASSGSRLRLVPGSGPDDDDFDEDDYDDYDDLDEDEDEDLDDDDRRVVPLDDADDSTSNATGGSVDELFARLRADQDAAVDEADTPTNSGAEHPEEDDPSGGGVVIAFESERATVAEVLELPADEHSEQVVALDAGADDDSLDLSSTTAVLDRRDERLENAERNLTRRLKRALSDQENSVLHTVRRDRKARSTEALIGDSAERSGELVSVIVEELIAAVDAGAGMYTDEDHGVAVDAEGVAAELSPLADEWVVEPLRDRLERAVADGDLAGDRSDLVERVRAPAYRELRQERLAAIVGDLVTAACNQGILAASRAGAEHVWLVDHGGLPCPDGEDNHLAGAVVAGEAFPTGDLRPPAQPGCRCLLVPAPR